MNKQQTTPVTDTFKGMLLMSMGVPVGNPSLPFEVGTFLPRRFRAHERSGSTSLGNGYPGDGERER